MVEPLFALMPVAPAPEASAASALMVEPSYAKMPVAAPEAFAASALMVEPLFA